MANADKDCHLDVIRLVTLFHLCFSVKLGRIQNDYKAISRGRFRRSFMFKRKRQLAWSRGIQLKQLNFTSYSVCIVGYSITVILLTQNCNVVHSLTIAVYFFKYRANKLVQCKEEHQRTILSNNQQRLEKT